jgi:4-diphosphocytidyl-2-C-methyl-D-erythritol kinase
MKALASHDLSELRLLLHNDLQSSAQRLCPGVTAILDEGPTIGGLAAMVSGSGPTIAFLCADTEDAIELTVGLSTMREVRAVHRAKGPVPGARVVTGI